MAGPGCPAPAKVAVLWVRVGARVLVGLVFLRMTLIWMILVWGVAPPAVLCDLKFGTWDFFEFYLKHRFSKDLDFFSDKEVEPQTISIFFKSIQFQASINKITFEQSFNRNLFFLHLNDGDIIKTEFTYFPFPRIERGLKFNCLSGLT